MKLITKLHAFVIFRNDLKKEVYFCQYACYIFCDIMIAKIKNTAK